MLKTKFARMGNASAFQIVQTGNAVRMVAREVAVSVREKTQNVSPEIVFARLHVVETNVDQMVVVEHAGNALPGTNASKDIVEG